MNGTEPALGSSQLNVTEYPSSFITTCPGGRPFPPYGVGLGVAVGVVVAVGVAVVVGEVG
jgi:hypothetical protein